MNNKQELLDLINLINKSEKMSLIDDILFQEILTNSALLLALSDDALADEFSVSLPTVTRWKNGKNVPYSIAKNLIYYRLKKLAFAQLQKE